jgi:hypothetical protein
MSDLPLARKTTVGFAFDRVVSCTCTTDASTWHSWDQELQGFANSMRAANGPRLQRHLHRDPFRRLYLAYTESTQHAPCDSQCNMYDFEAVCLLAWLLAFMAVANC